MIVFIFNRVIMRGKHIRIVRSDKYALNIVDIGYRNNTYELRSNRPELLDKAFDVIVSQLEAGQKFIDLRGLEGEINATK